MENLEFDSLVQEFIKPFDESEISQRKGAGNKTFSYIDPARYRYRALSIAKEDYTFRTYGLGLNEFGAYGEAELVIVRDGIKKTAGAFALEEHELGARFIYNPETQKYDKPNPDFGKVQNVSNTVKSLRSSLFKLCATELGIGLHLYEREAQKVNGSSNSGSTQNSGSSNSGSSGAPSGQREWDGKLKFKTGKNAGKMWLEVDLETIQYLSGLDGAVADMAAKELKRRNASAPAPAPQSELPEYEFQADTDDEVPF